MFLQLAGKEQRVLQPEAQVSTPCRGKWAEQGIGSLVVGEFLDGTCLFVLKETRRKSLILEGAPYKEYTPSTNLCENDGICKTSDLPRRVPRLKKMCYGGDSKMCGQNGASGKSRPVFAFLWQSVDGWGKNGEPGSGAM